MTIRVLFLLSLIVLVSSSARAEDFTACKALYDEAAYSGEFEDYKMLIPGKEGWIFRTGSDFKIDFPLSAESRKWFLKFQEALKTQKTEVVFAIIPTRGMAADDFLPEGHLLSSPYDPLKARESYRRFLAGAQEAGIHFTGTPELRAGSGYFNRTDHHWTTAGAREMAQAVSVYVRENKLAAGLNKEHFITSTGPERPFKSTFAQTIKKLCGIDIEMEAGATAQTMPAITSSEDLLAERAPPQVVLTGTSNSKREFDNNFDGFLKEYLSADVYNAAIPGGGITDSLIAYFNGELFRNNKPRLIVWEIPGYYRFDDSQMPALLQQLTPAVYGDCEKPLTEVGVTLVPGRKRTLLISQEKRAVIATKDFYARLSFDQPVKKNFSLIFEYSGRKSERIKFKRSERYPHDGIFYIMPDSDERATLKSVSLSVPAEMSNLHATLRLCPVPKKPLF